MDVDWPHPAKRGLMIIPYAPGRLPAAGSSRTLVVGMAMLPLILIVSATLPAVIVIAFTPRGMSRVAVYAKTLMAWTEVILDNSRSTFVFAGRD
jgi:hypothetical protein